MAGHLNGSYAARVNHPVSLIVIIGMLAALFAWLSSPRTIGQFCKAFTISVVFLTTLMGLGAVFGKTLGDFLRNVNG
jgi:H+/gluconate symporter-like permease